MQLSIGNVTLGWKVYVLVWGWLGIIVGLNTSSIALAALVWAVGASAAWILAPVVLRSGWSVVVRYLAASFLSIASVVMFIGAVQMGERSKSAAAESAGLAPRNPGVGRITRRPRVGGITIRPRPEELENLRRQSNQLFLGALVLGIVAVGLWYPRPWGRSRH